MRLQIPPPPAQYDAGYLIRAFDSIVQANTFAVSRLEAVDGILLQAPDGGVWKVTVDNSGNLTTTSVPLGQSGSPPY
jgi:hypothetical protein